VGHAYKGIARLVRAVEVPMPMYEFHCRDCTKDFTVVLTLKEREDGAFACPKCQGKKLDPVLLSFFAKTARKS
jgi:putative FmdB family regulatory protein